MGKRKMTDEKWDGIPITKLPPGKAYGADDLTKWAHNRARGLSGAGLNATKSVNAQCRKCGAAASIIVNRYTTRQQLQGEKCRQCGADNMQFGRKRRR
jgi:ribosomal protein L40E